MQNARVSPSKLPFSLQNVSSFSCVSLDGLKTNTPELKQSGQPGSGAADSSSLSKSSSIFDSTWIHSNTCYLLTRIHGVSFINISTFRIVICNENVEVCGPFTPVTSHPLLLKSLWMKHGLFNVLTEEQWVVRVKTLRNNYNYFLTLRWFFVDTCVRSVLWSGFCLTNVSASMNTHLL